MATTSADLGARTVDEQFLQMICNDEELVAAEFEAIIAAAQLAPPAHPGDPQATSGPPARQAKRRVPLRIDLPVSLPWHCGVGGRAHQRSPPPPGQAYPDDEKGGDPAS